MKLLLTVHIFLALFSKVLGETQKVKAAEGAHPAGNQGGKLRASHQEKDLIASPLEEKNNLDGSLPKIEDYENDKVCRDASK